ncbi:hypothetical protein B5P19_08300 [Clavibacter sepedonicus]|nr:hypothetical protein B5P19_08300 [Clavibacter sepedonicus]OQJ54481.1 hypothetical protein B5P20_10480 [Clavibacter sepedonicus]
MRPARPHPLDASRGAPPRSTPPVALHAPHAAAALLRAYALGAPGASADPLDADERALFTGWLKATQTGATLVRAGRTDGGAGGRAPASAPPSSASSASARDRSASARSATRSAASPRRCHALAQTDVPTVSRGHVLSSPPHRQQCDFHQ